jgi:hypothetical protein
MSVSSVKMRRQMPLRLGLAWYRDRRAWQLITSRFLPWLTVLSLAWEIAQLPLYTLWTTATPAYMAFAVLHCTLGDLLIAASALVVALFLLRAGSVASWRWRSIIALTALLGVGYTVFSEWMNTAILGSWTYASSMPRIPLGGVDIGLSPLLQWLVVPPVAIYLTRRVARRMLAKP